ncbi:MAG TPA: hypothetical protein ENI76_02140 [Ignavibacteria bacterium]|nr:hypothetical protein [Ignavibacteria bacterium]
MTTTKKRINVSVSKELNLAIEKLAKRDQIPQATKAEHLLRLALSFEEDEILDHIAVARDRKGARFVSSATAWR